MGPLRVLVKLLYKVFLSFSRKRVYNKSIESAYAPYMKDAFIQNPKNRKALVQAVELYHHEKYKKALVEMTSLLSRCESHKDKTSVLFFIALSRSRLGNRQGAIEAYGELVRLEPRNSTAWSNMGEQHRHLGRLEDALRCYREAVRWDGGNAHAHSNLAVVLVALRQYEEAVPYGRRALELNPKLYYCATAMAMAGEALGDASMREHYSRMALEQGENREKLEDALRRVAPHAGPSVTPDTEPEDPDPDSPRALDRLAVKWLEYTGVPSTTLLVGGKRKGPHQIGGPALGEVPLDGRGKPMRLLCALNCGELKNLPDFPREGLLLFYIADDGNLGLNRSNPTDQTGFRVLYSPRTDLQRGAEPEPSPTFPVAWECWGHSQKRTDSMPVEDHRFAAAFNALMRQEGLPTLEQRPEDTRRKLCRWFSSEGHRTGGYAGFGWGDPRKDPRYAKYDTLLLQLEQHEMEDHHVQIRFGQDNGTCWFLIPREKLLAGDFTDVLYWWDSDRTDNQQPGPLRGFV